MSYSKAIRERNESIYLEWKSSGVSLIVLSIKYGVSENVISGIITKELKKRKVNNGIKGQ